MRTMKYTERIRKQDLEHYIVPYHDEIFAHQPQLRIVCWINKHKHEISHDKKPCMTYGFLTEQHQLHKKTEE